MKKFVAFTIACALMFSCAFADTSSFITKWNSLAKSYGAPEISSDMESEQNGLIVFRSDNFFLTLLPSIDGYDKAAIISDDADVLLPSSAVLGMCLVDSYDSNSLLQFLGYLTYFYLNTKAGKTSIQYMFGSYLFGIEESTGGFMFAMNKL